jgi:toxin HigB-1
MIRTFGNTGTEDIFNGLKSRRARAVCPANLWPVARRKLDQLAAAASLDDLKAPPANRLELLKGDRKGQYSIRINGQFRVCFRWASDGPGDVEIVDYH